MVYNCDGGGYLGIRVGRCVYVIDYSVALFCGLILSSCGEAVLPKVSLVEDTGRSEQDNISSKLSMNVVAKDNTEVEVKVVYTDDSKNEEEESDKFVISGKKIDLSSLKGLPLRDGKMTIKFSLVGGEEIGSIDVVYDTKAPSALSSDDLSSEIAPGTSKGEGNYSIFVGKAEEELKPDEKPKLHALKEDDLIVRLYKVGKKDSEGNKQELNELVASSEPYKLDDRVGNVFLADGEEQSPANEEGAIKKTYYDVRFSVSSSFGESFGVRLVDVAGNESALSGELVTPDKAAEASLSLDGGVFSGGEDVIGQSGSEYEGRSYGIVDPFDEFLTAVRDEDRGGLVIRGSLVGEGNFYWLLLRSGDLVVSAREVISGGNLESVVLGENKESDFEFFLGDEVGDGDRIALVGDSGYGWGLVFVDF